MPTYENKCFACEHSFETVQKITEDSVKTCPECGKDEVKRIINSTSFQLKGGGWYASGYSKSPESSAGSSKSKSVSSGTTSGSDSSKTSSSNSSNSSASAGSSSGAAAKTSSE